MVYSAINVSLTSEQFERFKRLCKEKNLKYNDLMDAGYQKIVVDKEISLQLVEKDSLIQKLQKANARLQEEVLKQSDEIEALKRGGV